MRQSQGCTRPADSGRRGDLAGSPVEAEHIEGWQPRWSPSPGRPTPHRTKETRVPAHAGAPDPPARPHAKKRPNLAMAKPKAIRAMPVRIHASIVRSFAWWRRRVSSGVFGGSGMGRRPESTSRPSSMAHPCPSPTATTVGLAAVPVFPDVELERRPASLRPAEPRSTRRCEPAIRRRTDSARR